MTGTAKTEEVEFEKTYKLETTIVPAIECVPVKTGRIRSTEVAKWQAVANETAEIHKQMAGIGGNNISGEKRTAQLTVG